MQPAIFYTIVLLGLGLAATEARPLHSATEDPSIKSDTRVKTEMGVHMDISEHMETTMEPLKPKSVTINPRAQQEKDRNTALYKETTTTSPVKAKFSTIVSTPAITIQQRIDEDATTVRNTKPSMPTPSPKISAATVLDNDKSSQSKTTVETIKSSSASSSRHDQNPTTDMTPIGIEPRLSVTLLKILTRLG
ncbi:hypothetical protein AWZ03_003819 [Drosophila navojoa]|uniref:Uncharacterized protein n=1 Tax=Drosophila navojoa TaxID=7232 RepID=A0A484BQ28_DRONA|nr:hypothetical protein AWZ03_003819 [Drosophila navojoa]